MFDKQKQIYIPLLEHFFAENANDLMLSSYPYTPFIPVAFENYYFSSHPVFYVGIDTYYWMTRLEHYLNVESKGKFSDLIDENNKVVTLERILNEWRNDKGQFWSFVCKLHLYIRTSKLFSNDDLRHLNSIHKDILNEIGWGNMNSIEIQTTLKKEEIWDSIDKDRYKKLKLSSELLIDPIENLIRAYRPEFIIIMGWGGTTEHVFRGLKFDTLDNGYEENYRALYYVSKYDTKIIWTSHPSRFSYLQTNQDEMIPYIGDSLNLFAK